MKNEEISLRTKQMLAESLKRAMKKKPFSKITVSEIIIDCNVNRKTFYYHFSDIYSLLKWMFEKEVIQVVQNFDLLMNHEEAIEFVLDYVDKNDYIINCAYDSIGREEMKRFFYADFLSIISSFFDDIERSQDKKIEIEYKEFLIHFFTEGLTGMLMEYVKNQSSRNRQQIITYLTRILEIIKKNIMEY